MALEQELKFFHELLPNLLSAQRGKWIVIHGTDYDTWCCYPDALQAGYREHGLKPFLVKQILPTETPVYLGGIDNRVTNHPTT